MGFRQRDKDESSYYILSFVRFADREIEKERKRTRATFFLVEKGREKEQNTKEEEEEN